MDLLAGECGLIKIQFVKFVAGITGVGMVTPLGESADLTWRALLEGRSIRSHRRFSFSDEPGTPRVIRGAMTACAEAVSQAGWASRSVASDEVALIVGTSKGTLGSYDIASIAPPPLTSDNVEAAGRRSWGLAEISGRLGSHLKLEVGPRLTISAACASGLHALIRGAMMIGSGEVRRVLVVAAEASVHPLFVGSFRRLGVLAEEGELCRPFDEDRRGFLMSEAAAAVCLERVESDSKPLARVERFAMGGDASHLTGGDPDGKVLRRLLGQVTEGRALDMIHAHGTGTMFNDPMELSAMNELMKDSPTTEPPIVYSHKGALGHSLGAAGLVSVAINCLAHARGRVPGNVNTRRPLKSEGLMIEESVVERRIRRSLACASGFGGPIAVVSLVEG